MMTRIWISRDKKVMGGAARIWLERPIPMYGQWFGKACEGQIIDGFSTFGVAYGRANCFDLVPAFEKAVSTKKGMVRRGVV